MMYIALVIIMSILGGLFYRLGGLGKPFSTLYRDLGVSGIIVAEMCLRTRINPIVGLVLLVCWGLMYASLTSYRYFLPKPKDYNGLYYSLHGFMISFACFPFALLTHHWLGFGLRCVVCAAGVGLWSHLISNDTAEESGRGFILCISTPLLFL
jgi:hypothetical protein